MSHYLAGGGLLNSQPDIYLPRTDEPFRLKTSSSLVDTNEDAIGIDLSTRTLQTIGYEHHEIHSGNHYYLDRFVTLSINNVFDLQIITPDTPKRLHITFKIDPQSETLWHFYEDVTILSTGTAVMPVNNNRESTNTSEALFYEIINGSVALANADTATAAATQLSFGTIGAGREAGQAERTAEVMLKRNAQYSMRFIANAAGYIDYTFRWYEHTDKG